MMRVGCHEKWKISAVPLFAAEPVPERQQRAEREQIEQGKGDRDTKVVHGNCRSDDAGIPNAGGCGRAADTSTFLQDCSAANEANARDEALEETGLIAIAWIKTEQKQKTTTGHADDRKRADTGSLGFTFVFPANGDS